MRPAEETPNQLPGVWFLGSRRTCLGATGGVYPALREGGSRCGCWGHQQVWTPLFAPGPCSEAAHELVGPAFKRRDHAEATAAKAAGAQGLLIFWLAQHHTGGLIPFLFEGGVFRGPACRRSCPGTCHTGRVRTEAVQHDKVFEKGRTLSDKEPGGRPAHGGFPHPGLLAHQAVSEERRAVCEPGGVENPAGA